MFLLLNNTAWEEYMSDKVTTEEFLALGQVPFEKVAGAKFPMAERPMHSPGGIGSGGLPVRHFCPKGCTSTVFFAGPFPDGMLYVSHVALFYRALFLAAADIPVELYEAGPAWHPYDADHLPPESKTVYMEVNRGALQRATVPVRLQYDKDAFGNKVPMKLVYVRWKCTVSNNGDEVWGWQHGGVVKNPGKWCEL